MMRGEMAAARPLLEEATEAAERSGLAHALNYARGRVALLERFAGDYARASSLYEEHLAASREQNDLPAAAFTLRDLGALRVLQGNPAAAREYLEEATALFRRLGNRLGLIRCLEGMAQLAGASGAPARAVRLFGAAERQREVDRLPLPPVDRADYAALPGLRDALGEEAFSAAREEGRAMGLERATAYALGETGHGCC
jgi:non-specific serine/threonine protein kinase